MKKILAFTLSILIVVSTLISCSDEKCEHIDKNKDHICDNCEANVGAHGDKFNDGDHKCDYCQAVMSLCEDADNDGLCDECGPKTENSTNSARVAKWGVTLDTLADSELTIFDMSYDNSNGKVVINNQDIVVAPGTSNHIAINSSISGTPEVAITVKNDAIVNLSGWEVNNEFYCPIIFKIGASEDTIVEIDSSAYENEEALIKAIESEIEKATIKYYDAGTKIPNNTKIPLYFSWEWKFDMDNDMSDTALGNNSPQPNISISITQSIEQAKTFN